MTWFKVKRERKFHLRRTSLESSEGGIFYTGCLGAYGSNRVRETREEAPKVSERCRACDSWYTRNRKLVEREDADAPRAESAKTE